MAELKAFPEDWSTALCIAAHPDDLEYGTAAAVHRWVEQGKTVTYLIVTRGEAGIDGMRPEEAAAVREAEEVAGAREVGVEVVDFLDGYSDGVVEYGLALRRDLAREIRRRRPDVVLTGNHRERFAGGGTNQADHRAVGLAALDACADAGNRWIFPELVDEGFEPWAGVHAVALAGSPAATHVVDVTGHFEPAVRSLEAHARYLGGLGDGYPPPRELLGMILGGGAAAAGTTGVEHAIALEVFDR